MNTKQEKNERRKHKRIYDLFVSFNGFSTSTLKYENRLDLKLACYVWLKI